MIIQIAGTSGSGKTYVVRQLMRKGWSVPRYTPGREAPIAYDLALTRVEEPVYVVGGYDAPSGGCDNIKNVTDIYRYVSDAHALGKHVVFEGLFAMNQTRGPSMARELPGVITVLLLTTPLATCFASIDERRAKKGLEGLPETRRSNTKANYTRARNYTARMREAGAKVKRVSREEALPCLLGLLRWDSG